jgi:outer membrane protein, heavy metal efflux system
MRMRYPLPRAVLVLALLTGCATTSPRNAVEQTAALVAARNQQRLMWLGDGNDDAARREVTNLCRQDLTLANAIRVSLLANRNLQAIYEDLGIAQADLVQAGLLKNPTLSGSYDFKLDGVGPQSDVFSVGLMTDVVQLLTMGSRKAAARSALESTKYRVAGEVLKHVYAVKRDYYAVQSTQQALAMREIVSDAAEAAVEMARRQHEAGTINDLDLANEEALFAQISADMLRNRAELATARERLNRTMGVWGADTRWSIVANLPDMPSADPAMEHVESKAIAARYDLAAAHKNTEVVAYALALAKNTRWTGAIDAGVDFHRETEGIRLIGPAVSVQLPIFDQGQATIARIEAQLRMVKSHETALAVDIRSEVRELAARLGVARAVVLNYQRTLVPLRERIVELSQQQYDAMLLGVFQLLIAKQNQINTYREFIEALRDYWLLRAELELAIGGSLGPEVSGVGVQSAAPVMHNSLPTGGATHEHHSP